MDKLPDVCRIQYGYAFDSKKFTEDSSVYPLFDAVSINFRTGKIARRDERGGYIV